MREELQRLCDEYIKNKAVVKTAYVWDSSYMHPVCASILLDKSNVTVDELKDFKQRIKDKTGIFSDFRGHIITPMACKLATCDNSEAILNAALNIYDKLKNDYLSTAYLPLVALIIAEFGDFSEHDAFLQKAKDIYNKMKEKHPVLTSGEDGPFAAMMAFSERSSEQIVAESEKCFQMLRVKFFSANAVQSLSNVLAMGEEDAEEKCQKFKELFDKLKEKGYMYGTDYELATLGALSILPADVQILVEELIEVTDYLKQNSGENFFGPTKKQRMVHAATLICKEHMSKSVMQIMDPALINGAIALIAAQQAAMCAIIAATAASS